MSGLEKSCSGRTPHTVLERQLIADYLHSKGYSLKDVRKLPKERAKLLMKDACTYASLKLAEVESRAKFRQKIRFVE
jgi:hypothetical protein